MTNTSTNDVFAGDLHGFLVYPAAWKKAEADAFTPLNTLKQVHARRFGVQLPPPRMDVRARTAARFRYDHEPPPYQPPLGLRRRRIQLAVAAAVNQPRGNDAIRRLVADYVATRGRQYGVPPHRPTARFTLDPALSYRTADAFHAAQHTPQDPHVQATYQQLIREITDQYNHAVAHGFRFEPWLQPGQPYRNSREMSADAGTGHLWFFPTNNPNEPSFGATGGDTDPAVNPLVAKTGHVVNGYEMTANDLLRGVHDLYAHAKEGHEFGPEGEYNAWAEHAKTLSPLATQALTTETHGQNSWVNFGPHLRRPDGSIPTRGEPDYQHPTTRPFAEQKTFILPPEATPPHPYSVPQPLRMETPRALGGMVTASSYDRPEPLLHEQAAAKLMDDSHLDFLKMADDTTRRHTGIPSGQDHDTFTHLHGIGSWENQVEPSMATVFHKPVDALALQRIAAEVGSWARQHGVLAFSPHEGGEERMLHMRVPTHPPVRRLSQPLIANISAKIAEKFNRYFDPNTNGGQDFWMPGRTILPDTTGNTDVLVWVPPWEKNKERLHQAFSKIATDLKAARTPMFWPGTGTILGGTSPYSDEEANALTDDQKRDTAVANYQQVAASPDPVLPQPEVVQGIGGKRRIGRMINLRDLIGRFKTRLRRQGKPLKFAMSPQDIQAHGTAIAAAPHDDAPLHHFADHLADHGDPREAIVRQHVQIPRLTPLPNSTTPASYRPVRPTDGGFNNQEMTSGKPTGEQGHITFTPHFDNGTVRVAWWPHQEQNFYPNAYATGKFPTPLTAVLPAAHAKEIADHVGVRSDGVYHTGNNEYQMHDWAPAAQQLARSGKPLKFAISPEDVQAHAKAIEAAPHDDAPAHVFADHLADHGDPREVIVRDTVARGRYRSSDHRLFWRQHPDGDKRGWSYGSASSGNPVGEPYGHMSFVPHDNGQSVLVRWYPSVTDIGNPMSTVLSTEHAKELSDYVKIPTISKYNGLDWAHNVHSQQFARSPANSGAVVRGVYYAPGKLMPDAVPVQTAAVPDPPLKPEKPILAALRKRLKARVRHASNDPTRPGNYGHAPAGGPGTSTSYPAA